MAENEEHLEHEEDIQKKKEEKRRSLIRKLWIFIGAFAISRLISMFLIFMVVVPTESMVPTVNIGDKFLAVRVYDAEKQLQRGDIVVFNTTENPNEGEAPRVKLYAKRLIGLPGETVTIDNGKVSVNGTPLYEPYINQEELSDFTGSFTVPAGEFFFLGDNRASSFDSRYWKYPYVKAHDIYGENIYLFNGKK